MTFWALFCLGISTVVLLGMIYLIVISFKEDVPVGILATALTSLMILTFGLLCSLVPSNGHSSEYITPYSIVRSENMVYVEYEYQGKRKSLQSELVSLYKASDSNIVVKASWGINAYSRPVDRKEEIENLQIIALMKAERE